jgi:hypothetical protein
LPKFGNINFFLEGKGTSVGVYPGCLQPECTYFPVIPEDDEALEMIDEAVVGWVGCINCPDDAAEEKDNYDETKPNVKIFRQFKECKEEGKTIVEIIIKPVGDAEFRNFRFYESIPVDCVDEVIDALKIYLEEKYPGTVSIRTNPLILWSFANIKEEERISYILDKIISEECKEAIEGMGIAEIVEGGIEPPVADLSASIGALNFRQDPPPLPDPPHDPADYNWWRYTVTLEVQGNIGVTVNSRQKCYITDGFGCPADPDRNDLDSADGCWCDSEKFDIAAYYTSDYLVEGDISTAPDWVALAKGFTYDVIDYLSGEDDDGNPMEASYSFPVVSPP